MLKFTRNTRRLTLFLLFFWLMLAMPALAEKLTLFHTGNTGGLASAYRYEIQRPYLLASRFLQQQGEAAGLEDFSVSGDAVPFYCQQSYLWGEGFGIRELRDFLSGQAVIESRRDVVLLQSRDSLIADPSQEQTLMKQVEPWLRRDNLLREQFRIREAELIRYRGAQGPVYRLRFKQAEEALDRDPHHWELLLGFELGFHAKVRQSEARMLVIGQPQGEGSRRLQLLKQLRGPDDLLVDSGNLLEAQSAISGDALSPQRVNSLQIAKELGFYAINIGKNELAGGIENLRKEQQAYDLPLISASLRQKKEYLFEPYKIMTSGQLRIALIGIGDHEEFASLRLNDQLPADIEVLSPAEALTQALKTLRSQEQVDLVAVLTNLSGAELQKIAEFQDVNLLLASPETPLQHSRESLEINQVQSGRTFSVNSSPYAISLFQLENEGQNFKFSSEQLPVYFETTPDIEALTRIMTVRQREYEDALVPLLPDLGPVIREDKVLLKLFTESYSAKEAARRLSGLQPLKSSELIGLYPPYLTAELLANLEMNSLLETFQAEAVVFRLNSGLDLNVPGALRRLMLYESLSSSDTLERWYLNGAQLKKLLSLKVPGLVFAGADPGSKKIGGRDIGDKRSVYRVLMPLSVARLAPVRNLLEGLRGETRLAHPLTGVPGRIYVRPLVISLLERLRGRPDFEREAARLMKPTYNERQLLFSVQLDNFQLNLSGYNALNNSAYSQVRETRVTSPNSFTFGGRTRLAMGLDNALFGVTMAAAAKYEGLAVIEELNAATTPATTATEKESFTENQDDLLFSTELKLHLLEFPLLDTKLALTPYLEAFYDTEFTPTLNNKTKLFNPLQSELRGVLGLSMPAGDQLKVFKAGLALRRDFNVPDNLEGGLDLKLVHQLPITSYLSWNNDLNVRYFLPTANDNLSSLGLIAQLVTAFDVTLTDNLSLRLYADGYLFQGKRPETSQLGASVILGIGLGFDRIWKPWYEPLLF